METKRPPAVAVYCASSIGTQKAYQRAAVSLGNALAFSSRPLVYGGGSKGIMGIISGAVLEGGGEVTGVIPWAMIKAGGEGDKCVVMGGVGVKEKMVYIVVNEKGREKVNTIVVDSMHERKIEMAKRVGGFIGLPGGFGTFEEILEVITWTQISIHNKPVVLINVLGFYDPLRTLIHSAVKDGFIQPQNERLVLFVDGPSVLHSTNTAAKEEWKKAHEEFDWGKAALEALDGWVGDGLSKYPFDWNRRRRNRSEDEENAHVGIAGA